MNVIIEERWKKMLANEFKQPYFESLASFIRQEYKDNSNAIFPKGKHIFRAFDACPFDQVKVVILGQDPYPTRGHADGLCFSVEPDVRPLPKSLINIYKELESDLGIPFHNNGHLYRWAEQGVLLLNTVLTVREGSPNSHAGKGWELFTDAVIYLLNEQKSRIVYLLWGSKAIKKAENVDRSENLVLTSPHPSPLSAYRGFFGCRHFSQTNVYLEKQALKTIQW